MLEIARVVAIHPEDHSIDAIILRTNQRVVGVPVMAPGASSRTGQSNLPPVTAPSGDARWNVPAAGDIDALAVLAQSGHGNWIGVGFLFPQVNGVLSRERGRQVTRHASGAWSMIAPDGTVTLGHPSGATVSMGPTMAAPNPNGGDVDGRWAPGANAGAPAGIRVSMPSGTVIEVGTDGKTTIKASEVTFDTPMARFTGEVQVTGDVMAGTVSLRNHVHRNVTRGASDTDPPKT